MSIVRLSSLTLGEIFVYGRKLTEFFVRDIDGSFVIVECVRNSKQIRLPGYIFVHTWPYERPNQQLTFF